ncbi:peptidase [candidate division KSB3 bacterium]|uniref:Peptidase n=1 Tax=candidate division KSB3 bacterium TaxID=2044937 RepID=A0A2G6KHC7_9BACT|nr:MAG: peptidase [candidate division KSB3 bacterium]
MITPYGSWKSPITSDAIVAETIKIGDIALDNDTIYWVEMRPSEGGRYVLVRRNPDGSLDDVTPAPYNVRTRVHEYGGGACIIDRGSVYFINFADQRFYCQTATSSPQPMTPEGQGFRYADAVIDRQRKRLICVREDHSSAEQDAVNTLVSLPLGQETAGEVLVFGADFYSNPCVSPDGNRLAWLSWNHPNMPWDGTELWLAEFQADGTLGQAQKVAGGQTESIFQPQWSPEGTLYFVSDRTGWWNLYRWHNGQVEALCDMKAEFGMPQWVFGMSTYAFISAELLICAYNEGGTWRLARFDIPQSQFTSFDLPYTSFGGIRANQKHVVFSAASPSEVASIVTLHIETGQTEVLRRSSSLTIEAGYISLPTALEFPTENGSRAHGFFYAPCNKDEKAPDDEHPPLLVISHGGPTAATTAILNFHIQYWTSRGFAVLDVNYGGSTGYGRAYRERLRGNWGIVDIADCANGARFLVDTGKVDGKRLAIRGGSAGGYTTLGALAFQDVFQAGASYYGVSDIEALALETHKFESRYMDSLIGAYPEQRDIYLERSPIQAIDRFSCPIIFFQGLEDKIVPPNQAERMFEALKEKGIPTAYVAYEGEQHGFRQAKNVKHALDTELYFYSRIFNFEPAEPIEPITIENM